MDELLRAHIEEHARCVSELASSGEMLEALCASAAETARRLKAGGKVLFCGNGGSAADAQHFAAELVVRLERNRRAFAAVALTTDSSVLTACANDFGYEGVFARQVEALGRQGDVLVAISTSGNSPNVLEALEAAGRLGMYRIALTGEGGGKAAGLCEAVLAAPSRRTMRVQECHVLLLHAWCDMIERGLA